MRRNLGWLVGVVFLVLTMATPVAAQKDGPARTVQDDAGLFSREALDKANAKIAQIKRQFHKDLLIETVGTLELPAGVNPKDNAQVNHFIDTWALDRFKNQLINGIYVGIVKHPAKYRVEVGPNTIKNGFFTVDNRKELEKILGNHLKAHELDQALVSTTDFVLEKMSKNHPAVTTGSERPQIRAPGAQPAPPPQVQDQLPWWTGYLCIGLVVLAVLWVIMGLFRRATSPSVGGGPGMAGPAGGGGGGFFSSMLGGMFGAAAGMWMYNNFFGGHSSSAYGGDYSTGGQGQGGDYSQGQSDVGAGPPSGGGGDWGDNSGGDNSGGGSGGGDWGGGGGDTGGGGGGGDFGGGGGGDFGGGGGGGGDW